jgi:MoaA/NifB/PqqE/SkfB family radical SAM enzyme
LLDKKNLPNWPKNKPAVMIQNIRLAIDDSCNLSCPSCRTKKIFEKNKFQLRKKIQLADKIVDYVRSQPHKINLHIGSDGDPFASLIYRYFIQNIKDLPNIRFTIQTNGLLINKMHERHFEMFRKLDVLNLSIDGATKETYEKLRRGGSFQQLIRNLEYVKNLKNKLNFKFIIHCVVQKDNYKEIPLMVRLSKNYLADKIWFNRINNWNTFKDFDEQDVCNKKNLEHVSYLQIIENVKQSIEYKNNYIETATL